MISISEAGGDERRRRYSSMSPLVVDAWPR
jgi:hypothetical protein